MVDILLFIHVLAGIVALITGLMIFLLKKGTVLHVNIGTIYAYMMYLTFITGTVVSIIHSNLFLLTVGFFSFYMVLTGVRYNRIRSVAMVKGLDKFITVFFAICFLFMFSLGVFAFMKGVNGLGIILTVFTAIGVSLLRHDFSFFLRKRQPKEHLFWKREHIGRMIGSYIAATTAFAVNNIHIEPDFITWLLPTALGIPLIIVYTKKHV